MRAWVRTHPVRTLGALVGVAAASPLLARGAVWLVSLPHAELVLVSTVGLGIFAGPASSALNERAGQARLGTLVALAWIAVVAVVAMIAAGAWWIMGAPALDHPTELTPRALDAIATRAFAIVAGLGGAALLVISYRRQRTTEAENDRAELAVVREDTKLFTDRFTAATAQLGDPEPAIKLAGVHALAHLADDAPTGELVQMVIDVLCAYLRMPYEPAPGDLPGDATDEQTRARREEHLAFAGLREVRHTVIRLIGTRLREETPWRGRNYDFTGTVFDGGDLHGACFTGGMVDFREAEFSDGAVDFSGVEFTGGEVVFSRAEFTGGEVVFTGARFVGGKVDFREARLASGKVDFVGAEFSDGAVAFLGAEFTGGEVDFSGAEFSGGTVAFLGVKFSGGVADFSGADFTGGVVGFSGAKFSGGAVVFISPRFSGGKVNFSRAEFSAGAVVFTGARFAGSVVDFREVEFADGMVDFSQADFTGGKLDFSRVKHASDQVDLDDAEGTPPTGLLEASTQGRPGVVILPEAWQPTQEE